MNWIDKLEKRLGGFALHNLALYIIIGQAFVYFLVIGQVFPIEAFFLIPSRVADGEIWRLISFIFVPRYSWGTIWILFSWYIFWFMSQGLEAQWGTFRFNMFIWLGALFTILASLLIPYYPYTNHYIHLSVLMAFATLYPNFELRIYFILPVKVKWIALLTLAIPVMDFFKGPMPIRFIILASLANYMVFFGKDLYHMLYFRKRRIEHKRKVKAVEAEAFHTCESCGATDTSNPDREFRYRDGKGICSVCLEKEAEAES
jgi:hypothetical protein